MINDGEYIQDWFVRNDELWDIVMAPEVEPDWDLFYGESPAHRMLNDLEHLKIGQFILSVPSLHKEWERRMRKLREARQLHWPGLTKNLTGPEAFEVGFNYVYKLVQLHVEPRNRDEAVALSIRLAREERAAVARGEAAMREGAILWTP